MSQGNAFPSGTDAFVLAGGGSTRMGTDKALLRLHNTPLIEHALNLLRSVGLTPRIVGSRRDLEKFAPVIPDRREHCGPLSGLEAGLLACSGDTAIFLPVDVPLLPAGLLVRLLMRAELTGALATLPRALGQPQPLSAVYRRDLLPAISKALDERDYKVMRVVLQGAAGQGGSVDLFHVETVMTASSGHSDWPAIAANVFLNCNTPEDLARAALLAGHLKNDDAIQGRD